jgi:hypothetical protein
MEKRMQNKLYNVEIKWTGTIAVVGPIMASDDRQAMKIAQDQFEENSNGFIHLQATELNIDGREKVQ